MQQARGFQDGKGGIPGWILGRLRKISDERVREFQDKLNDHPRKCVGWKTPREVWSDPSAMVCFRVQSAGDESLH